MYLFQFKMYIILYMHTLHDPSSDSWIHNLIRIVIVCSSTIGKYLVCCIFICHWIFINNWNIINTFLMFSIGLIHSDKCNYKLIIVAVAMAFMYDPEGTKHVMRSPYRESLGTQTLSWTAFIKVLLCSLKTKAEGLKPKKLHFPSGVTSPEGAPNFFQKLIFEECNVWKPFSLHLFAFIKPSWE